MDRIKSGNGLDSNDFLKRIKDIQAEFSKDNDYRVNLALLREVLLIAERQINSGKENEFTVQSLRRIIDQTKKSIEDLYSIGEEIRKREAQK